MTIDELDKRVSALESKQPAIKPSCSPGYPLSWSDADLTDFESSPLREFADAMRISVDKLVAAVDSRQLPTEQQVAAQTVDFTPTSGVLDAPLEQSSSTSKEGDASPPQPATTIPHPRQCCSRDHNADGNCDVHLAPGVYRKPAMNEPVPTLPQPREIWRLLESDEVIVHRDLYHGCECKRWTETLESGSTPRDDIYRRRELVYFPEDVAALVEHAHSKQRVRAELAEDKNTLLWDEVKRLTERAEKAEAELAALRAKPVELPAELRDLLDKAAKTLSLGSWASTLETAKLIRAYLANAKPQPAGDKASDQWQGRCEILQRDLATAKARIVELETDQLQRQYHELANLIDPKIELSHDRLLLGLQALIAKASEPATKPAPAASNQRKEKSKSPELPVAASETQEAQAVKVTLPQPREIWRLLENENTLVGDDFHETTRGLGWRPIHPDGHGLCGLPPCRRRELVYFPEDVQQQLRDYDSMYREHAAMCERLKGAEQRAENAEAELTILKANVDVLRHENAAHVKELAALRSAMPKYRLASPREEGTHKIPVGFASDWMFNAPLVGMSPEDWITCEGNNVGVSEAALRAKPTGLPSGIYRLMKTQEECFRDDGYSAAADEIRDYLANASQQPPTEKASGVERVENYLYRDRVYAAFAEYEAEMKKAIPEMLESARKNAILAEEARSRIMGMPAEQAGAGDVGLAEGSESSPTDKGQEPHKSPPAPALSEDEPDKFRAPQKEEWHGPGPDPKELRMKVIEDKLKQIQEMEQAGAGDVGQGVAPADCDTPAPAIPTCGPHPNELEKKSGVLNRYMVLHADGSVCDPDAVYFVLRLDSHPDCDEKHVMSCRAACRTYAGLVKDHLPALSHELFMTCDRLSVESRAEIVGIGNLSRPAEQAGAGEGENPIPPSRPFDPMCNEENYYESSLPTPAPAISEDEPDKFRAPQREEWRGPGPDPREMAMKRIEEKVKQIQNMERESRQEIINKLEYQLEALRTSRAEYANENAKLRRDLANAKARIAEMLEEITDRHSWRASQTGLGDCKCHCRFCDPAEQAGAGEAFAEAERIYTEDLPPADVPPIAKVAMESAIRNELSKDTPAPAALPICPTCDEHHPPESMCPPHEVRGKGHDQCQICHPAPAAPQPDLLAECVELAKRWGPILARARTGIDAFVVSHPNKGFIFHAASLPELKAKLLAAIEQQQTQGESK